MHQDTDANDIPRLHIPERGYPILKLFPAADKLKPTTVPMLGDGGRSGAYMRLYDIVDICAHFCVCFV